MKKVRIRKIVVVIVAAVLLLTAYFVYSGPMTLPQLYPMLTLDKCTEIRGYYCTGTSTGHTEFTAAHNSEAFQKLCGLFYERNYRRSLRDILPRGTRTHQTRGDDFQWDVYFCFEGIEFPDGSTGSGALLNIQNWYGELDLFSDGEWYSCRTHEQEAWAKEVLAVIQNT